MVLKTPERPFKYEMFIGGNWVGAKSGKRFERKSPAHDVVVGTYAEADTADVDAAVSAARTAFDHGSWPRMKGADRATVINDAARAIRCNAEELAYIEVLESGKPISQARTEMEISAQLCEYAASLARHIYGETYNTLGQEMLGLIIREPMGVAGIITPWNFPLLIMCQKLPFALATGCTVVCKPSELTSGTMLKLAGILKECGLPDGVLNVVTGYGDPVGARIAEHDDVDVVSFTGSTRVGRLVLKASAGNLKKVGLELGGKSPNIIFPDADLDAAVDAVVFGVYFNAGECCKSGSILLVHRDIADEFVTRVIARAKTVPVGDPLDEATKIGAIINETQFDKIRSYIAAGRASGADLKLGGNVMPTKCGKFIEPTIFTNVTPDMKIAREEIFGPVLSVMKFDTEDDAVRIANGTHYGLSAAVWTSNLDTAFNLARGIKTGTVWVNTYLEDPPELVYGGCKESGLGRENGRSAIEEFMEQKTIQVHLGPRTNWWHVPKDE
jgi:betaine-aldehyde dehydrogenase